MKTFKQLFLGFESQNMPNSQIINTGINPNGQQNQKQQPLANTQVGQIVLPTEYPDYSKPDYWNNRYRDERGQVFDWYLNFAQLKDIIMPRLFDDKDAEILNIGCGNSEMSEKIYQEGYHYITNADFSTIVIEEMKERHSHLDDMDYVEMDITEPMDLLDSDSFTVILDKGTLDCVACSDQYFIINNYLIYQCFVWKSSKSTCNPYIKYPYPEIPYLLPQNTLINMKNIVTIVIS